MFIASPKAGATLTMRLMFGAVNKTAEAKAHGDARPNSRGISDYPLTYAHQVWSNPLFPTAEGSFQGFYQKAECYKSGWLCVAFVRNPLDRAVSGYIHTLTYHRYIADHFKELEFACNHGPTPRGNRSCQVDASFYEFSLALDARANTGWHSSMDGHFMPQIVPPLTQAEADSTVHRGVVHIPLELFNHMGDSYCPQLDRLRRTRHQMIEAEAAAFGSEHTLQHYLVHQDSSTAGTEWWHFDRILGALEAHTLPSYDTFWRNQTFCRHVIGDLYRADLELYTRVCSQRSLLQCEEFRLVCETQLARLRDVCGLHVP